MICTDFFVIESSWVISIYRYGNNHLRWLGDHDKIAADRDPCLIILGHVAQGYTRVQKKKNM